MTPSINQIRRDLVALGPMAPVRAVYEVGKRSGAHGAVLRRFVGGAKARHLAVLPAFGPPSEVSNEARARCLADAAAILEEGHRVFGTRFPIGTAQDWNALPGTDLYWPADAYWWDIDIRTDQRLGDVKWTWEFGRHRDLVILARAVHLDPSGGWLVALEERLRSWFEATPSEIGIHWYSNLEIALRVIAWMQIHALVHDVIDPKITETMARNVVRAERHLLFDFPYTVSSMRNNHLLGDALGLIAIDRFTGGDGSRRTARLAERFFAQQLTRHMHADGSMIEDSLSYHRFVLEMLIVKRLLGDHSEETVEALAGAAHHLLRLGALEGHLPQWGDWDEGRVLASSGDPMDVAGSTALALVLGDETCRAEWTSSFDEVAWYSASVEEMNEAAPVAGGNGSASGGILHARRGEWAVWLKTGLQPSHQHSDLSHLSIRRGNEWVVIDPGTGTYNGPLEIRNAFRTSAAHNGLRVAGDAHITPHRAFRWLGTARGAAAPVLSLPELDVLFATHDAYVESHGTRLARAVVVSDNGVWCIDWLEAPKEALLTLALAPGAEVSDGGVVLGDGARLKLAGLEAPQSRRGQETPFAGWFSRTYGTWEPATWLEQSRERMTISWWSVADSEEKPKVEEARITLGAMTLEARFDGVGTSLSVNNGEGEEHLLMIGASNT